MEINKTCNLHDQIRCECLANPAGLSSSYLIKLYSKSLNKVLKISKKNDPKIRNRSNSESKRIPTILCKALEIMAPIMSSYFDKSYFVAMWFYQNISRSQKINKLKGLKVKAAKTFIEMPSSWNGSTNWPFLTANRSLAVVCIKQNLYKAIKIFW